MLHSSLGIVENVFTMRNTQPEIVVSGRGLTGKLKRFLLIRRESNVSR